MTSQRTNPRLVWALLGALAALPGVLFVWGYTVDDALISARVASNIAHGNGYRFNPGGSVVDAVTPLGWAYLLALAAKGGPWSALSVARATGAIAWLGSAALLSRELASLSARVRAMTLVALAVSLPLAAWAVSGMETPWVTLLATLAVTRPKRAALFAGLAAAWRPELLGWALTGSLVSGFRRDDLGGLIRRAALVFVPSLMVGLVRYLAFGSPFPLALEAKPADLAHGLRYALGAVCLSGPPFLLLFIKTFRKLPRAIWAWGLAFFVHLLSVAVAGGDWMSFYRLVVPTLPGVLWVGAHLLDSVSWRAGAPRLVLALVGPSLLWVYQGKDARRVASRRSGLIEAARQPLSGVRRVGAVDVGWVGAATDAEILDFGGVTDPSIAVLPGGHTTKRIAPARLGNVDALVLLLDEDAELRHPWFDSHFYYGVDRRVARGAQDLAFHSEAIVPLLGTRKRYVILRRR